eukprot:2080073-Prymnesium_polylepis.1
MGVRAMGVRTRWGSERDGGANDGARAMGGRATEHDGEGRADGGRDGGDLQHHEETESQAGAGRGLMGGCACEG